MQAYHELQVEAKAELASTTNDGGSIAGLPTYDTVYVDVWWWPELNAKSAEEVRTLATKSNLQDEISSKMTFWEKVRGS